MGGESCTVLRLRLMRKLAMCPIGGSSAMEGLRSTGLPRLVFKGLGMYNNIFFWHLNFLLNFFFLSGCVILGSFLLLNG